MCADYTPLSVKEMDVRNFCTPPLEYKDVSTAEILLKIEAVETYVKQTFFEGGSIPANGRIGVLLLIVSNLLSRSDLLRKYGIMTSEQLGDYRYEIAGGGTRTSSGNVDPLSIIKSWQKMGLEILESLSSSYKYKIRKAND